MGKKSSRAFLLAIFFLSGMAGLIYEIVWSRQLTLIFGTSLYAIVTVLAVFMAGLGLGSLIFGRIADRVNKPLRLYALLEMGIGIYALTTPLLFSLISAIQVSLAHTFEIDFAGFSIIRVCLSLLALIIPTTLMGGTLPIVSAYFGHTTKRKSAFVGALYALNTLGAVTGVLLASLWLISHIGVRGTVFTAAGINLVLALIIIFFFKQQNTDSPVLESEHNDKHKTYSKNVTVLILGAMAVTGFAALSLETSWSHVMTMIIGSSTYALSIILFTFLLGIALGSIMISCFVERIRRPLGWFIVIEMLIGISALVSIPLIEQLPQWFLTLFKNSDGAFWNVMTIEFLLASSVIIIPTLLMGAAFPLAIHICISRIQKAGYTAGLVYSVNTFGAVLGPLLTGFVLIPVFGMQTSIVIAASAYVVIATTIILFSPGIRSYVKIGVVPITIVIIVIGASISPWDRGILNSGVYTYAQRYISNSDGILMTDNQYSFYKEGLAATVSVKQFQDDTIALFINGKTDASTSGDMMTQLLLGHLPLLLHEYPEDVLVVGLGSGVTLGAVEQHSTVQNIDVVEIEPAVYEASQYFTEHNYNALEDSRLTANVNDARNFILTTDNVYDVITAEPSNPWMAGNANLFTQEQFELYKQHLKPGGIMFQWAHLYQLQHEDVRSIVATFQSVFPHTAVWHNYNGRDVFMIGTDKSLEIDVAALQSRMSEELVEESLSRAFLDNPLILLSYAAMNENGAQLFSANAPINTDNTPVIEFSAPHGLYLPPEITVTATLAAFEDVRADVATLLSPNTDQQYLQKITLQQQARKHVIQGEIKKVRSETYSDAINEYEAALDIMEQTLGSGQYMAEIASKVGNLEFAHGNFENAAARFGDALKWYPNSIVLHHALAQSYINLNKTADAMNIYEQGIVHFPNNTNMRMELGVLYGQQENADKAIDQFSYIIEKEPDNATAYFNLGNAYSLKEMMVEAQAAYQKAAELEPDMVQQLY